MRERRERRRVRRPGKARPEDAIARILDGDVPLTPVETEALDFGTIRIAPGLRATK